MVASVKILDQWNVYLLQHRNLPQTEGNTPLIDQHNVYYIIRIETLAVK